MIKKLLSELYLNDANIFFDIPGIKGEFEANSIDTGLSKDNKLILLFNNNNIQIDLDNYVLSAEEGELGEEVYTLANKTGTITFQFFKKELDKITSQVL